MFFLRTFLIKVCGLHQMMDTKTEQVAQDLQELLTFFFFCKHSLGTMDKRDKHCICF